ncbi:unnamed protein product [Caretta caretta]
MEKMECLLADWIDDLHQKKMPKTLTHCEKRSLRNAIRRHAWPDAVHSFVGFDAVPALRQEIIKLEKDVGFKEVEKKDVELLLESHTEQLTNEELIELHQRRISEESKDDDDNIEQEARSPTTKNLSRFFGLLYAMIETTWTTDPFREPSAKVFRALNDAMACYREIYPSKIHAGEQTSI